METWARQKGPEQPPSQVQSGSLSHPPQIGHRSQLTNGLLTTSYQKGKNSILSHLTSPSSFKYSTAPPSTGSLHPAFPLLSCLLLPCSVFNKLLSPLFCLRWILSPPAPIQSECTTLCELSNRHLFLTVLEAGNLRSKGWEIQFLVRAVFLVLPDNHLLFLTVCSHGKEREKKQDFCYLILTRH